MEVSLTHVLSCGELNVKKGMTGEGKLLEYGKEIEKQGRRLQSSKDGKYERSTLCAYENVTMKVCTAYSYYTLIKEKNDMRIHDAVCYRSTARHPSVLLWRPSH